MACGKCAAKKATAKKAATAKTTSTVKTGYIKGNKTGYTKMSKKAS